MSVNLCAKLQRLARGMRAVWPGMQHRTAIAQARDTLAIEQMRVDTRHLLRGIGTQPHHAPRNLINQLEGLQIQRLASAGQ